MALKTELRYTHLGVIEYAPCLRLQHSLLEARKQGKIGNLVLTVQHPSIYTLGRRGNISDILINESERNKLNVDVHSSDRGGEVTYHGPGQLVVYPILKLNEFKLGANSYVKLLEQLITETVKTFGITAHCIKSKPGVYVERAIDKVTAKIAAIGVRISSGITMHGFALNATTDLQYFNYIVPCGSPGMPGASIQSETGMSPRMDELSQAVVELLADKLQCNLSEMNCSEFNEFKTTKK